MRTKPLAGQVAVVTGAAQGIGAAVCTELAGRGAVIAAIDTNEIGLARLVDCVTLQGNTAVSYPADVTDSASIDHVVHEIERAHGPIHILVNVAGVLRTGSILDTSDDDWATTFAVNTTGVFNMCRAVGRRMVTRKHGTVVTVASNAAGVPRMHMAAYSASKAASALLTKCLGLEFAGHGIRCNVVSPGSTDTPMLRSMWTDDNGPRATLDGSLSAFRVGVPLGKLAQPADVADAVAFLVSDQANHITMHDLYVDGGAALRA